MKATVDKEGTVTPKGAARVLAIVNEPVTVPDGGPITGKVAWRTLQCTYCNEVFEHRSGETATHECEAGDEADLWS